MFRRWAGPLITMLILGGVALIIVLNLNPGGPTSSPSVSPARPDAPNEDPVDASRKTADFREYPIGEPQLVAEMKIAAVWLPPIQMNGMADSTNAAVIHLEADVHATEGNRNGFAKDEFIPYLKINYKIVPAGGGPPIHHGELVPMVARDGLHYGASVAMPKAGKYKLIYDIQPPSAGGLGRHSDSITGVAPWWKPFRVTFDWDYEGLPRPAADRR